MPSNGRVAGKLVVQMDLQSAGFMNSATGINKAIRSMRSNLRTLDKFYKANGDEVGRLSQKYKQSSQLMTTYKEKLRGLKSELKGLKPNTQAFVQQQNQIRRTEADMAQLSNEMKAYRKQLLYQDSALQRTNAKYKQQAAVINSSIARYKAEGNALKQATAERRKVRNSIAQHNASLASNEKILNRVRVVMGKNSAEYAEQRAKLKAIKAETASYNAQLTATTGKMRAMAVQQRAMNTGMGRAMVGMQKNKSGLIDMRNSFMGLTAAAIGVAYPVARALGGAVKATVEWEDAVANVNKTINPATDNIDELKTSIRSMAKVMPQSQSEIGNTMAMAAQLGIKGTKNLKNFTEIATQMGVATDMSAEDAAKAMARIANVTGMPNKEFKNLGSTIVNLGNNMAAQEGEITNFMMRLSGTGTTVGLAEKDIAALSAAMAGVGIRAEAGGSAMSKVMSKINTAVMDGGDTMQKFAEVSGMSGQEFAALWKNDPYEAIMKFEGGVKNAVDQGENHKDLLKELGITELRETDTVLRLANGNKQLADARTHANKGWKEGTALSTEAEQKYKSLGNQMKIFMNHVRDLGISIGEALTPILIAMMKALNPVLSIISKSPKIIRLMVVALALIPIAAIPVLASLAAITGAMGLMGQAMNTATVAAAGNSKALRLYALSMGLLTSPIATVKKGLGSVPGLFWGTGNAAKGSGKGVKTLGGSFLTLLNPMKWIRAILPVLSVGFRGLLLAFRVLTGPIGLIVTGIILLYKAFKSAYDNVEWFRKGINGLVYVFKVFGGGIIGAVTNKIKDLGNWFSKTGSKIKNDFTKNLKDSYKALDDDDLLKQGVNGFKGAMKVLGTASDKATDKTKVLGKGVSKGTKEALGQYVKFSENSTKVMAQMRLNNGKESKKLINALIGNSKAAGVELVKQQKARNKDNVTQLTKMLKDTDVYTADEANMIITRAKKSGNEKVKKTEELNKEIAALEAKAMSDGKLSEKERKAIQAKYDERNKIAVKTLSAGQKEQRAIMSRLDSNVGAINTKEAQNAIKEVMDAQTKAIKDAKKKRDKLIMEADEALANGTITKKEHDNIVKKVTGQYDTETKEAIKKGKESKKKIKKASPGIENLVNMDTGKAYTKAEQWWNQFSDYMSKAGENAIKDWGGIFQKIWAANVKFGEWIGEGFSNLGNWFSEQGADFAKRFKEGWAIASQASGDLWGWIKQTGAGIGPWFSQQGSQFANKFKEGWKIASQAGADLWSWVKETGSGIGDWFSQKGRDFWSSLKNGWNNAIATTGDIWSNIKQTGANIGAWFSQKGSQLWGSMKSGWNNAISTTGDLWNSLTTWLSSKWGLTKQWFVTKGSNMWSSIKQGWNTLISTNPGVLWKTLTTTLGTAWAGTKQWFITKGQQMGSAISTGWSSMKSFVVNTFSAIWTSVKVIWKGIWSTISYWTGAIWNRIKSIWGWIKSNTVGAFTFVWSTIKRIWTGIKNTIVYWTGAVWNRVKGVWGWIKSNTASSFTWVWNKLKAIWTGIKGTIVYWTGAIWNRIKAVWSWIKSNTSSAFTWVWNKIKSIWNGIKGTIVYWTQAIWNRVKSVWNWIKSNTASAFTWVWNKIKSIWSGIKGTITYWTGVIWDRIKSIWNTIKTFTANVFNSVWGTVKRIWTNIKNAVIDRATAMWNKVRGIWNSLKSGTTDIFNKAKNIVKGAFEFMKKHSVDLVTGMWSKVSGIFNNMKDGTKSFASKITGHINGMVDGIKTGLNALIKGVNWVGGKLGIDKKIPKLHTGTESTHRQNFVSNGKIKKPTFATVNDKGSGNGKGKNGHQEVIQRADGSMYAPKGKDVTVPLGKGDVVHSGRSVQEAQQAGALPQFSKGTGKDVNKKLLQDKKKKKNKEGAMDAIGLFGPSGGGNKFTDTVGNMGKAVLGVGNEGKKKVVKKTADTTKKGKEVVDTGKKVLSAGAKSVGKIAGDLMEYVGNPGKLMNLMLKKFGVDFGNVKGEIPKDMMWDPMWKGLKGGVKSLFDGWLTEADGAGDGGYIDLSKGINFGFGFPPGYPFNRPHNGLDINYPYGSKLYSTLSGTAVGTNGYNGGFGNNMTITSGNMKAIYGHMSKLAWTGSKKVKPGDYLGLSGGDPSKQGKNAGDSTGAHLHYEMQRNGKAFDPTNWLKTNNGGGSKNKKASAWKDDIKRAAKQMKVSLKGNDLNNIISLINAESGGNAGITQGNIGDINNRNGNPAKGLLQYIPQTFSAYAMKGHKNIKNGYDQLLAFFNNKYWRSQFNPNGGWSPSGPRRFAHGGMIKKHGLYEAGEGNREEMILPLTNKVRAMQLIEQAKSFMGVDDSGDISTVNSSSNDSIVTQLLEQNNRLLEALISTVEGKELVVDKNAIVETANTGLGRKFKDRSYTRGGR